MKEATIMHDFGFSSELQFLVESFLFSLSKNVKMNVIHGSDSIILMPITSLKLILFTSARVRARISASLRKLLSRQT